MGSGRWSRKHRQSDPDTKEHHPSAGVLKTKSKRPTEPQRNDQAAPLCRSPESQQPSVDSRLRPKDNRKTELRIDGSLTVILALFPFGWQLMGFDNVPIVGLICWIICLGFVGRITSVATEEHLNGKSRLAVSLAFPALLFLVLWVPVSRHIRKPNAAPSSVGTLVPRTVLSVKKGIVPTIEIGTSGVIFTKAISGGLRKELEIGKIFVRKGTLSLDSLAPILSDCDFLIESIAGKIMVSMTLLDSEGRVIARLVRNEWDWGGRPISFDRNYNQDSLEVQDHGGDTVLQVTLLPDRVRLQLVCFRKNGNMAYVVQSFGRDDAVVSFNNTAQEDLSKIMRPMFKYPSSLHLGELDNSTTVPQRGE